MFFLYGGLLINVIFLDIVKEGLEFDMEGDGGGWVEDYLNFVLVDDGDYCDFIVENFV